jgi:rhodanese-related sulfurtransferase
LAKRTGAEIIFGAKAGAKFPHRAVRDNDELKIGKVTLRVLETPGHTPESISLLVIDMEIPSQPQKVLTGDTLFIGDVGRPDLAGTSGYTSEQMAAMLYESLHGKLMQLDDSCEVYPAHGAGSMCGRNISKETSSTIGEQRKLNYALKEMPRDEFVRMMTDNLPDLPRYFYMDAQINRTGAPTLDELPAPHALVPAKADQLISEGAIVLDVREANKFGAGHVPGSVNIGLKGQFATWGGSLIQPSSRVLLIAEDEESGREAVMRLARVGLENVAGYLDGGIAAWHEAGLPLAILPQISVDELHARIKDAAQGLQIVDVRRPAEFADGHVPGAVNIPMIDLEENYQELDARRPTHVICAGGYRSSAAASLLESKGFNELYNVTGGTSAWINAQYPTEQ